MTQPPQNPYMQPQQPPAKKNWFLRHKILTAIGALVIIGVVVNLAGGGESAPTGGSSSTSAQAAPNVEAPAAAEQAPGIGAAVRDGKFEFVVQNVERGVVSVGDQYTSQTPQGEYVLVTVNVANIGNEQQLFDTTSQKLLDGQGREYSTDTLATVTNDPNLGFSQINPGNSLVATLVYDVPAGTAPSEIELHDSLFSGGVTVAVA
ncbi:DUF4352 domain-containing protein [Rhodococcus sp. BP-149]|uniref:DUF4352 domain-containing protein n=1 Tax=unclassified Rhodococcus (in: high G+C Gram-positive bacteria) TaxID=192944 RepID=UPI001C9AD484|nr:MULTISPECIES: DUF4352 domain-containing protein [unclassified Rhodococcus (in: high G+C Gram-positive bacteria)]MBY6687208.1 DUF4352 domain-containing protein [Rhodococcus sp. BP-288]MBY6694369.1 DUF4352 domain-containing protein [Rhodococcus sp. BP-188]MBY6698078.1 DUF4352 domain-containing protein [Rhodococcus sp. BP-285]MBY6704298.1 DUF4352 domain-containing protein [Rhodococcus sp. BP-283]MBY6712947.1 DUF4352 domain-containing protein [Rhodococcus sp. BP-160]